MVSRLCCWLDITKKCDSFNIILIIFCFYISSAAPNIKEALEKFAPEDSYYIYVDVGDRQTYKISIKFFFSSLYLILFFSRWKDIKCSFRTDKDTHLSVIPSLIRWKQPMRLEGEQCEKTDLLEMFLTED